MEQAPELQNLDTSELAKRASLGRIVAYIQEQLRGPEQPHGKLAVDIQRPALVENDPPASASPSVGAPAIERFTLEWVEAPLAGWGPVVLRPGAQVVITDDGAGVAPALAERLIANGLNARRLSANAAQNSPHVDVDVDVDAVIFLGGLLPANDYDDAMSIQRETFQIARAIATRFAERGGAFITVQDTGGRFGLGSGSERAWLGGLSGLAKTAALEWPQATVKAIDIERGERSPETLADALAEEILFGGLEREVGLTADGARGTLVSVARPAEVATEPRLRRGAVIVASGGARGVTAASLTALAEVIQPRLVILGRTALEDESTAIKGVTDEAG
jgi:hypothetical protein